MDFIDSSCFCSVLGEPFHWAWEDAWGWQDGCELGRIQHGCIPCEPVAAGTDLTSEVHPRAAIPRDRWS